MDGKHTNDEICHGVQCEICREKTVKLFRNMKHFLKRFVYTHDLICGFILPSMWLCSKQSFFVLTEKNLHGVSEAWRLVITMWISTWKRAISTSFYKKSKHNMEALMLFQEVLSSCAETSFRSEWLSMGMHKRSQICSSRRQLRWTKTLKDMKSTSKYIKRAKKDLTIWKRATTQRATALIAWLQWVKVAPSWYPL